MPRSPCRAPSVRRVRRAPGGDGATGLSAAPATQTRRPQPPALQPRPHCARAMAKATSGAAGLRLLLLLLLLPLLGKGESCRLPAAGARSGQGEVGAEQRRGRVQKLLSVCCGQRAVRSPAAWPRLRAQWLRRAAGRVPRAGAGRVSGGSGTRAGRRGPVLRALAIAAGLNLAAPFAKAASWSKLDSSFGAGVADGSGNPESPRFVRGVLLRQETAASWFPFPAQRPCVTPPALPSWPAEGFGGSFEKIAFPSCAFAALVFTHLKTVVSGVGPPEGPP